MDGGRVIDDPVGIGAIRDLPAWQRVARLLAALAGVGVLAALLLNFADASRERDRALRLQSHSYEVMILARQLSGMIARAEASLGRFVISGDKDVGRIYYDEWKQAGSLLSRLDEVTRDNRAQALVTDRLEATFRTRGDELAAVAIRTNYGQNAQALRRYYDVGQVPTLERLKGLLERIITRERALLTRRSRDAAAKLERTNRVTAVLAMFGAAVVLSAMALAWAAVGAFAQRRQSRLEMAAAAERAEELERAVAEATGELRGANAALQGEARERAAAEAQLRQVQKMEAVGQLTGGIAHDFNNMLAVILGGLELARRRIGEGQPDNAARHIDSAMEGGVRAAALTRRLLGFARAEPLLPAAFVPGELVAGMSDLLSRTLGERIRVEVRDDGVGWRVFADRHQLENALLNLAVNARDAMENGGTLTIATRTAALGDGESGESAAGDHVLICVADTGAGMDAQVLDRVFEPFFTTKAVGKGTGLGLSQIFGFVRQSGGRITIDSAPGSGTMVTIALPRHVAAEDPVPAADPLLLPVPAATGPATEAGIDILVVEDDPRVLAATLGALEELGHRAVSCTDPARVPALLVEHDGAFDLILTDVVMPGRTGPELIADILPRFPHLAVLYVTGYVRDAGDADAFGGHVVLRKPFTIGGLDRAIEQALGRGLDGPQSIAAE